MTCHSKDLVCDVRKPRSQAEAACWAIQEAARQCAAARMRTHFGGPAQTFAAVEKGLQARLEQRSNAAANPTADGMCLKAFT